MQDERVKLFDIALLIWLTRLSRSVIEFLKEDALVYSNATNTEVAFRRRIRATAEDFKRMLLWSLLVAWFSFGSDLETSLNGLYAV